MLLSDFYRWLVFFLYVLVFSVVSLSLFSFNQLDTSLLFISSAPRNSLKHLGIYGSYLSSFLIYCVRLSFFRRSQYFFYWQSIHQISKSYLNFVFLRFFLFLISLILFEQFFIFYMTTPIDFFGGDYLWGTIRYFIKLVFSVINMLLLFFPSSVWLA